MNRVKRFLVKRGLMKGKAHERAEVGRGVYGRQPTPGGEEVGKGNVIEAKAQGRASIKMRVWRERTKTWEEW